MDSILQKLNAYYGGKILKKYYIYIVKCADHTLYTGYTNHLTKRIQAHNNGKGAKYTKHRRPVQLLYAKSYPTKSAALKAEYAFKQQSRQQKLAFLTKKGIQLTTNAKAVIEDATIVEEDT